MKSPCGGSAYGTDDRGSHEFSAIACKIRVQALLTCRLPDQVINVRVDPLNFALVHTVAKYLDELAPGWKLGQDHTVQWPPCVNLVLGTTNQSSVFETEHVLG